LNLVVDGGRVGAVHIEQAIGKIQSYH